MSIPLAKEVSELLEFALQSSVDPAVVLDAEGKILDMNVQATDLFSTPVETAIGRDLFGDLLGGEMAEGCVNNLLKYTRHRRTSDLIRRFELTAERPSGKPMPMEVSISAMEFQGELIYCIQCRDLTQRRSIEGQLRTIFDEALDMICLANTEGYFVRVNPAFSRVLGYSEGELLSKPFADFIHPEDRERTMQEVVKLSEGIPTLYFENRYLSKSGDYKWLAWKATADPASGFIYAMARDVSDQKRIESEVRLFSSNLVALNRVLTAPGQDVANKLQNLLRTGCAVFGLEVGAIKTIQDDVFTVVAIEPPDYPVQPGERLSKEDTYCGAILAAGKSVAYSRVGEDPEMRLHPVYKRLNLESYIGTPIRINGKICGSLSFSSAKVRVEDFRGFEREFIELMAEWIGKELAVGRANEALDMRARELERSNRALDDFATVISHDLKTPLRGLASVTAWLERDSGDDLGEEALERLSMLRSGVRRMSRMIDGVLRYSLVGRSEEDWMEVDLNSVLQSIVRNLDKPSDFEVRLAAGFPVLRGNPVQLEQIFQNLISNAIKYNNNQDAFVELSWEDRGNHWRFDVADNGPGIDPRNHEQIFQLFNTLHARDEDSTGLGLSLVRKMLEGHGGTIRVESEPFKGARFIIELPKEGIT